LSCVLLRGLPLPRGVPIIGDTHNVEFDVLRRMSKSADGWLRRSYASVQWRATARAEHHAIGTVDLLLATSERDRRLFEHELDARRIAVVPNGIDLEEFAPSPVDGEPGSILFSGLMSYYPNQQAVRWFLDRVFPLVLRQVPNATFVVAGAEPPSWLRSRANERIRITGPVTDMRPYLEAASVLVAPLRIAGGTRVKILEAQAVGRPVVSTTLGAEGLRVRHGVSLLLADESDAFAARVTDALTHRGLARSLAIEGQRLVRDHYDWNQIGQKLALTLQDHVGLVVRESPNTSRPS
jgi:polysaccharide biosynthesis protein PslH